MRKLFVLLAIALFGLSMQAFADDVDYDCDSLDVDIYVAKWVDVDLCGDLEFDWEADRPVDKLCQPFEIKVGYNCNAALYICTDDLPEVGEWSVETRELACNGNGNGHGNGHGNGNDDCGGSWTDDCYIELPCGPAQHTIMGKLCVEGIDVRNTRCGWYDGELRVCIDALSCCD